MKKKVLEATLENMIFYGGSFVHYLGACALAADPENLTRLIDAFPEYFDRYSPRRFNPRKNTKSKN